jgi:hypothetical protein
MPPLPLPLHHPLPPPPPLYLTFSQVKDRTLKRALDEAVQGTLDRQAKVSSGVTCQQAEERRGERTIVITYSYFGQTSN